MLTPFHKLRKKLHLTLAVIESATGIDTGALSRIERGIQGVSAARAEILAAYMNKQFGHAVISELEIMYPKRYSKPAQPEIQP